MKPSLRAPFLGSVTSLKLNHWLLDWKNMHISGPPGRRRAGGWASSMLRVLKVQFKTFSVLFVQKFRRFQQPEPAPTPLPFSQASARPLPPSSREKCPEPRSFARWVDAEDERGERDSGETGMRFKLSSDSRKVCVRGAFSGRYSCKIKDLGLKKNNNKKNKIRTAHPAFVFMSDFYGPKKKKQKKTQKCGLKKLRFSFVVILDFWLTSPPSLLAGRSASESTQ